MLFQPQHDNAPAVTVHWPWQHILAGEAQFSQLMHVIFGNLAERGFNVREPKFHGKSEK